MYFYYIAGASKANNIHNQGEWANVPRLILISAM